MIRLKELRAEKELTQRQLGKIMNVEAAAVSKYETGRVILNAEQVERLCDFFDCSSDYLLGKTGVRKLSKDEAYKKGQTMQKLYGIMENDKLFGLSAKDLENLTETQKKAITMLAEGFIRENSKKEGK